jgi:hypothetical protein
VKTRLLLIGIWTLLNLLDLLTTCQGNPSQEANVLARYLWQAYGFWAVCLLKATCTLGMIAVWEVFRLECRRIGWYEERHIMAIAALTSTAQAAVVAWNCHILA